MAVAELRRRMGRVPIRARSVRGAAGQAAAQHASQRRGTRRRHGLQRCRRTVVARIRGLDRYDTSARFSGRTVQAFRPITYVATGADFPDALVSGPASGFEGSPVLL